MVKVLVVSGNFKKSYAIFRSLARHKMQVFAVFYKHAGRKLAIHPNMFSRYLRKRYLVPHPSFDELGYIKGVISAALDSGAEVVVPSGFIDFLTLSKYKYLIEQSGLILASPPYDKILSASDKTRLPTLARDLSMNTPEILSYKALKSLVGEDDIRDAVKIAQIIKDKLKPPYVVKNIGDASKPSFYSDPLDAASDLILRAEKGLVQEFVAGKGFGYFALAVEGSPLLEFMHRRVVEDGYFGGPSLVASAFFDEVLLDLGRRLIKELRWTGVIMVEFKKDLETGEYYLIELNPKFWGSLDLAIEAGADFPALLVKALLGEKITPRVVKNRTLFSWITYSLHSYISKDIAFLRRIFSETIRNRAKVDIWLNDPAVTYAMAFNILKRILQSSIGRKDKKKINGLNGKKIWRIVKKMVSNPVLSMDMDGTLVRLPVEWRLVYEEARKQGLLKEGESIFSSLFKLRKMNSRSAELLHELVKKFEISAALRVKEARKTVENIMYLKKLIPQLKIAIITKQSFEAASVALERLGINGYVDLLVTREDAILREEQLKIVSSSLGKVAVHVGDSIVDVIGALRVGAEPALIAKSSIDIRRGLMMGVPVFGSVNCFLKSIRICLQKMKNYLGEKSELN